MCKLVAGGPDTKSHIAEIDRQESAADDIIREVLTTVRKTFLTPFDRGAIKSLIASMDDAIDEMQSTARAVDLFDVAEFRPEMQQMVAMIVEAAQITAEVMPLLRDVSRNGGRIHELTERLVRLEGQADDARDAGLKNAYQRYSEGRAMLFIVEREIYNHLERVTDAFEDVANEIDGIVIDHA
jgi:uncharacterized protein